MRTFTPLLFSDRLICTDGCSFCRMNIVVRVITGAIQDADDNSYDRVTIVYVVLAALSTAVSFALVLLSWKQIDLRQLQWTRKQRRARGDQWNERKRMFHEDNGDRNRRLSKICFCCLCALVLGSWVAYFWGVATGNNS